MKNDGCAAAPGLREEGESKANEHAAQKGATLHSGLELTCKISCCRVLVKQSS